MSDVTVAQFAEVLKVPVEKLLSQLDEAGIKVDGSEDTISEDAKLELLTHLRRSHGKQEAAGGGAKRKVALKGLLPQSAADPSLKDRFIREAQALVSASPGRIEAARVAVAAVQAALERGTTFLLPEVLLGEAEARGEVVALSRAANGLDVTDEARVAEALSGA